MSLEDSAVILKPGHASSVSPQLVSLVPPSQKQPPQPYRGSLTPPDSADGPPPVHNGWNASYNSNGTATNGHADRGSLINELYSQNGNGTSNVHHSAVSVSPPSTGHHSPTDHANYANHSPSSSYQPSPHHAAPPPSSYSQQQPQQRYTTHHVGPGYPTGPILNSNAQTPTSAYSSPTSSYSPSSYTQSPTHSQQSASAYPNHHTQHHLPLLNVPGMPGPISPMGGITTLGVSMGGGIPGVPVPVAPGEMQYTDEAACRETHYLRRRCFNCHTTEPPSWRRSALNPGKILCNRCGLYERTHLRPRPPRLDELRANKSRVTARGASALAMAVAANGGHLAKGGTTIMVPVTIPLPGQGVAAPRGPTPTGSYPSPSGPGGGYDYGVKMEPREDQGQYHHHHQQQQQHPHPQGHSPHASRPPTAPPVRRDSGGGGTSPADHHHPSSHPQHNNGWGDAHSMGHNGNGAMHSPPPSSYYTTPTQTQPPPPPHYNGYSSGVNVGMGLVNATNGNGGIRLPGAPLAELEKSGA